MGSSPSGSGLKGCVVIEVNPRSFLWELVEMKKFLLMGLVSSLLFGFGLTTQAEITVRPEVTKLDFVPEKILAIGNSYLYWNCGLPSYLKGMIRQKINPKIHARLATIGHSNLT
ncbi:MAG: hypothetical protein LUC43_07930, partial [Burkholderiales bacterium]|nr:hypothetical protein [Burkholderiales bacterium]